MTRLVGQQTAQRGLAAALINPRLDRVCVRGGLGAGKTALLQSVLAYFSAQEAVVIPAHATIERLLGSMEPADIVKEGKLRYVPGLLQGAKAVVTDQFEHMPDENRRLLVHLLKNKEVQVERDGVTAQYPLEAQWFYGLGNEESSAPILEHAKLCVQLVPLNEASLRAEIVAARDLKSAEDRKMIQAARARLKDVHVPDSMLRLAVEVVQRSGCKNQEADLDLIEAARALTALEEKDSVGIEQIEEAATYVLAHRLQQEREHEPQTAPSEPPRQIDENKADPSSEGEEHGRQESGRKTDAPGQVGASTACEAKESKAEPGQDEPLSEPDTEEEVERIAKMLCIEADLLFSQPNHGKGGVAGKRGKTVPTEQNGRFVRTTRGGGSDIALHATLLAAAPYMPIRTSRPGMVWAIEQEDLRFKLREKQSGYSILFVVDASRSIAAKKRMQAVKGAVTELLKHAYQKRDRIGLVTFRKAEAKEVLPFTKQAGQAKKKLLDLPTGGKTPLAAGLKLALDVCEKEKRKNHEASPFLVVLTDGNANETLVAGGTASEARAEAAAVAKQIAMAGIPVFVIDAKNGRTPFDLAQI
ncbi:VWA domain-containing protein [Virgibacillus dakarensis]|nr:VWA domain-containing protein [Virgibacillus dakarensis]